MTLKDLLVQFIIVQGTYSIVIFGAIVCYALLFWEKQRRQQQKIVGLALSHLLLITATSMTLWYSWYPAWHPWYFLVFIGYLASDVFAMRLWIRIIKINKG